MDQSKIIDTLGTYQEPMGEIKVRPSLLDSRLTDESFALVLLMVASARNEWQSTIIFHAGLPRDQITPRIFPFFIHTILSGLVPPFSAFFCFVLKYYGIQVLHLHLSSVTILCVFAYLSEAYLGVKSHWSSSGTSSA